MKWIPLAMLVLLSVGCRKSECDKAADAYYAHHKPYHQRLLKQYDAKTAVPLDKRSELDRQLMKARGIKTSADYDRALLEDETKRELVPRDWIVDNCKHGATGARKAELSCMAAAESLDAYAECRRGKGKFEVSPPQ